MIKVVPFIETICSEKFKIFLCKPFETNMIYSVSNNDTANALFTGWRGKDMGSWYKFVNDDGIVLEFYANEYIIKYPKKATSFTITLPSTLNEFINDLNKYGVQLYWGDWIDEYFEPKEYLRVDEIREYFINLLKKMNKSHELQ